MFSDQTETRKYSIFFLILCAFSLLRPMVTISFFADNGFAGVSFLDLFSLGTSYLFIILILIHLKSVRIDGTDLVILLFCTYCFVSIFWGSAPQEVLRLILPAAAFFFVKFAVTEKWQIKQLLLLIIIGHIVPIVGSAVLISLGKSIYMTVYHTGIEMYTGMYSKIHTLGHSMFIFL